MIKINGEVLRKEFFPDGTQRLKTGCAGEEITLTWNYENDTELFTILAVAKHYQEQNRKVTLKMPYIPNARMDRVKSPDEVFTLKVFCSLINQAGFERVRVLDAHSNMALALLDRVEQMEITQVIRKAALDKLPEDILLYFPDEGSRKRYEDLFPEYRSVMGMKKRDWCTGKITGLDVITNGVEVEGKTVLMMDDIVSFGGSLYYSALILKELGAAHILGYATHTENSVLDENKGTLKRLLDDGMVEKLFTTDSIYTGSHKSIEVTEV